MVDKNKEIVLASEDVQRKNIKVAIQYGNETRKMVLELGKIVDALQNQVITKSAEVTELRRQLSLLQGQFYAAGTASYADSNR